ncbi:MAG: acyltransferase [Clostridia bacterium]|nr:acyltransferase [Clostridia bacterium]
MEIKRDITIDILKTLGIILILLAHVNPPGIIFQLRNFDVVLLVILSSILAENSYKKCNGCFEYIKKRFIRLIIPVWIFLTFFFIGAIAFSYPNIPYSFKDILNSYLLIDGIGYVWIYRIYLLGTISIPILLNIKEKMGNKKYNIILIFIYILYEIIYFLIGDKGIFLKNVIYYIIPYGICISLGLQLKKLNNKKIIKLLITFLLIFFIMLIIYFNINGTFITTNKYKYPPRLYYLSYAIALSLLAYYLVNRKNIFNIKERLNTKFITFIGSHTMWIYLWHILYIIVINYFLYSMHWIIKFLIVLLLSIFTTYIQSRLVKKVKNNFIKTILDC